MMDRIWALEFLCISISFNSFKSNQQSLIVIIKSNNVAETDIYLSPEILLRLCKRTDEDKWHNQVLSSKSSSGVFSGSHDNKGF